MRLLIAAETLTADKKCTNLWMERELKFKSVALEFQVDYFQLKLRTTVPWRKQQSVYNASHEVSRYRYIVLTRRPSLVFKPPPPVNFDSLIFEIFFFLVFSFYVFDITLYLAALTDTAIPQLSNRFQRKKESVYNDSSLRSFHGQYVLVARPSLSLFPFVSRRDTLSKTNCLVLFCSSLFIIKDTTNIAR